jgi:hypothetical protein
MGPEYAWNVPGSCYDWALSEVEPCPKVYWWWIAAAIALGLLVWGRPARDGRGRKEKAE